ncbi:hypothetical protein MTO96_045290 [Rhipicephalus appendiculatus]
MLSLRRHAARGPVRPLLLAFPLTRCPDAWFPPQVHPLPAVIPVCTGIGKPRALARRGPNRAPSWSPAAAAPVSAVRSVPSADVPALVPSPVATPTDDSRPPSPRAPTPVIPAADGPAGATSPPREATPSRASSPSSSPPGTRPVTPASAPLSPSSPESTSPSDPDIGQVEDEADDDPDSDNITDLPPDNTNLFSKQVRVLRAALREAPDNHTWERLAPAPAKPPINEGAARAAEVPVHTSQVQAPEASLPRIQVTTPPKMASIDMPVRENCFTFNVADSDVSVDELIDAVELTAGEDSVLVLQHMGGSKFLVCTRNVMQATKLIVAEGFRLNHEKVSVEAVGPPITFVNIYRFPAYLSHEVLVTAPQSYGKLKSITYATVASRHKLNGVRVAKIEMCKPIPNFMHIQGHTVMLEYRGMRRVCARCGDEGHMANMCSKPYCKRCGEFGHDTEGCSEECKRCGGKHGTRECFRKKSYASAARTSVEADSEAAHTQTRGNSFPRPVVSTSAMQVLRPQTKQTRRKITDYWNSGDSSLDDSAGAVATTPATAKSAATGETDTPPLEIDTSEIQTSESELEPSQKSDSVTTTSDSTGGAQGGVPPTELSEGDLSKVNTNTEGNELRAAKGNELQENKAVKQSNDSRPIVSCGHYVIPNAAPDGPGKKTNKEAPLPPRQEKTGGTKPGQKGHTAPEHRRRSRSRRRTSSRDKEAKNRTPSAEGKTRRLKSDVPSSGSDAPPQAKKKKNRPNLPPPTGQQTRRKTNKKWLETRLRHMPRKSPLHTSLP